MLRRNHPSTAAFLLLLLILFLGCDKPTNNASPTVGVFLFAQHPIIDQIYSGFKAELDRLAAKNGVSVEYVERNADGDMAQANAIAGYFRSQDVNAIFVVGVPAAQALKATGLDEPVILGGPPDVVQAGLAPSLSRHNTNFTGTQYLPPVGRILDIFTTAFPNRSRIAAIHNPGESNSMSVITPFLREAKSRQLEIIDLGVSNAAEIEAALRAITLSKPDGIFIPTDNLVYSNLDRILAHAAELNIPVFNCTRLAVEKGAVFSLATDYTRVGEISAEVASQIVFSKRRPQDVDIVNITEGHLYINVRTPYATQIPSIPGYSRVDIP